LYGNGCIRQETTPELSVLRQVDLALREPFDGFNDRGSVLSVFDSGGSVLREVLMTRECIDEGGSVLATMSVF